MDSLSPKKTQLDACPVCSRDVALYLEKSPATYYRCKSCGLIFQNPLPTLSDMESYANEQYQTGVYKDYIGAKDLKYATFRNRLPEIQSHQKTTPGGRLLDIGCSCGFFIDIALDAGYDAYGLEFSSVAIAAASNKAKPRITQCDVNALDRKLVESFDVVTAFDIIEHTFDPKQFLLDLRTMLKPGGVIAIATPDTGHSLRWIMGGRWPMLQPMQHTFLFSRKSLSLQLEQTGFEQIEITTARKALTLDYLSDQIRIHNPSLYGMYRVARHVIPRALRQRTNYVNIGEIMALARKS